MSTLVCNCGREIPEVVRYNTLRVLDRILCVRCAKLVYPNIEWERWPIDYKESLL
jgi:hypothetical protein